MISSLSSSHFHFLLFFNSLNIGHSNNSITTLITAHDKKLLV